MDTNKAVVKRIFEICEKHNTNICEASLKGGMSPSALYEVVSGRTKYPKIITIKRFCEGVGITLSEFFNEDYFNDIVDD